MSEYVPGECFQLFCQLILYYLRPRIEYIAPLDPKFGLHKTASRPKIENENSISSRDSPKVTLLGLNKCRNYYCVPCRKFGGGLPACCQQAVTGHTEFFGLLESHH